MENHAKPASVRGLKSGSTLMILSPPTQAPPWTNSTAGNGPVPSGICASKRRLYLPARPYSILFKSSACIAVVKQSESAQAPAHRRESVIFIIGCDRAHQVSGDHAR